MTCDVHHTRLELDAIRGPICPHCDDEDDATLIGDLRDACRWLLRKFRAFGLGRNAARTHVVEEVDS